MLETYLLKPTLDLVRDRHVCSLMHRRLHYTALNLYCWPTKHKIQVARLHQASLVSLHESTETPHEEETAAIKFHLTQVLDTTTDDGRTLPRTSVNFYNFHQKCKESGKVHLAYSVAANLIEDKSRTAEPSALMWWCALWHLKKCKEDQRFLDVFQSMLSARFPLFPTIQGNMDIWSHALSAVGHSRLFHMNLYRALRRWNSAGQITATDAYRVFMNYATDQFSRGTSNIDLIRWNASFLRDSMIPSESDRLEFLKSVSALPRSAIFREIWHQFDAKRKQSPAYDEVMAHLCRLDKPERAQRLHHFLLENGELPERSETIEMLLKCLHPHNLNKDPQKLVESLLEWKINLSTKSLALIAAFLSSTNQLEKLQQVFTGHVFSDRQAESDTFWSSAIRAAVRAGQDIPPIVKIMTENESHIGPEALRACMSDPHALSVVETFMTKFPLKVSSDTGLRYMTIVIRYLARRGHFQKAHKVLRTALDDKRQERNTQRSLDCLKRDYFLGLLEGEHYDELETRHREMQHIATGDTWNILLRARLSDGRILDAHSGLKHMEKLSMIVENSTAQEFMKPLLRTRRRGRNPDVLDPTDRRRYLSDVKMAKEVAQTCLKLGGRVQPETWREICKRLGLYGEFESLERLTDWLIPQYSSTIDPPGRQYFRVNDEGYRLPPGHPDHPLSRLLRPKDIAATITRGSKTHKIKEALALVVKWHQMGVVVDPKMVRQRIDTHLEFKFADKKLNEENKSKLRTELMTVVENWLEQ